MGGTAGSSVADGWERRSRAEIGDELAWEGGGSAASVGSRRRNACKGNTHR